VQSHDRLLRYAVQQGMSMARDACFVTIDRRARGEQNGTASDAIVRRPSLWR